MMSSSLSNAEITSTPTPIFILHPHLSRISTRCCHEVFYVRLFCLHVCLYTTYMPGDPQDQKRASDPLQLELQMAVSHHVGGGN